MLGRCVHRRAARAAQAQRGRHAGDGAKGHRAERGVTPARPGPFPHPRGLDRHSRRPGARADQRDLPPVDGERGGDVLDGELIPADARRPDGALPARVGSGRGRHAERGLDGLEARPPATRSEISARPSIAGVSPRPVSSAETPARPLSGPRLMARLISWRSTLSFPRTASERPEAMRPSSDAARPSPGGSSPGQVDAAIADQAFGDRRPGTEGRQRSGQHRLRANRATWWRRRSRSAPPRDGPSTVRCRGGPGCHPRGACHRPTHPRW